MAMSDNELNLQKNEISIVTSLYKSKPYVLDFYQRHLACIQKMTISYEFIFVDDGSHDGVDEVVESIIKSDPNVTLISLSRNFGQHAAMFAGLEFAQGRVIYATDCDLEEAPENLVPMFQMLNDQPEVDVVYCVTRARSGNFVSKVFGDFFYTLFDYLSSVKIPRNQAWQRLMRRKYVQELLRFREAESLPAGLMVLAGFNQAPYLIDRRFKGVSSYSIKKRVLLAVNSLIAFSSRPLAVICGIGFSVTIVSILVIAVIVFRKLTSESYQVGWSSLIASIWCVGGLILTSVGVVGLYVAQIFSQVKERPKYIIKSISRANKSN